MLGEVAQALLQERQVQAEGVAEAAAPDPRVGGLGRRGGVVGSGDRLHLIGGDAQAATSLVCVGEHETGVVVRVRVARVGNVTGSSRPNGVSARCSAKPSWPFWPVSSSFIYRTRTADLPSHDRHRWAHAPPNHRA